MSVNRCHHCGLRNWAFGRVCDGCGHILPAHEALAGLQQQTEEEVRRRYRRAEVKHPRCLSAVWFACTGSIPGLLIWWILDEEAAQMGFVIFWLTLVPTIIAASYGACLGARILQVDKITTASRAFWRGGSVALLSFVTLMALLALSFAGVNSMSTCFAAFLFLTFFGFIYAGWEAFIIGGLAGWLLYKRYR